MCLDDFVKFLCKLPVVVITPLNGQEDLSLRGFQHCCLSSTNLEKNNTKDRNKTLFASKTIPHAVRSNEFLNRNIFFTLLGAFRELCKRVICSVIG